MLKDNINIYKNGLVITLLVFVITSKIIHISHGKFDGRHQKIIKIKLLKIV